MLNWFLAILAAGLWGTTFTWYFWRDMKRMWKTRNDKWFRGD